MRSQKVKLGNGKSNGPLKVCIQAEFALLVVGVHHPHLLVLPHPLLEEVGLALQGNVFHEVKGVFHIIHLILNHKVKAK